MPMFAAIAIKPARRGAPEPAASAASCAIASSGEARMAIPAIVTIIPILCRNISILLLFRAPRVPQPATSLPLPPQIPVGIPGTKNPLLMIVAGGESYVTHRKNHEDDRLNYADNRAERIKRERYDQPRQAGENAEHGMVGEHVGVKTNAQRKRPEQIVGQLD